MSEQANEFARWVLNQSFDGCDIDGGGAQEEAHRLGLITSAKFDPDFHLDLINIDILERGDEIFTFSKLLKE
jgi:hypothetical protein